MVCSYARGPSVSAIKRKPEAQRGRAATAGAPWPSWPCSGTGKMLVAPLCNPVAGYSHRVWAAACVARWTA
jgi:hypothetical protein